MFDTISYQLSMARHGEVVGGGDVFDHDSGSEDDGDGNGAKMATDGAGERGGGGDTTASIPGLSAMAAAMRKGGKVATGAGVPRARVAV